MPSATDWMEWQAWYAWGAILMPKSALRETAEGVLRGGAAGDDGPVACTAERFEVSLDAARVRLGRTGFVRADRMTAKLF